MSAADFTEAIMHADHAASRGCGSTHYSNMAAMLIAAGYGDVRKAAASALRAAAESSEAMERARRCIEDELVEWRDGGMSMLDRRNGLAIYNRDGTPSSIIRFGFEDAFRIALNAEADRMEAEVTP